jgi:hypothetical protein
VGGVASLLIVPGDQPFFRSQDGDADATDNDDSEHQLMSFPRHKKFCRQYWKDKVDAREREDAEAGRAGTPDTLEIADLD